MEISWLGHACFQLRGKHVTLIADPFSPQSGHPEGLRSPPETVWPLQLGKVTASIVTVSHNHPGHNYVQGVGGNPRIVRGPGEYEISDVLITGVASYHDDKRGQERGRNTIYVIHMDDVVICHLGDLGHTLQEEQLEEVADADVLLVPIGGQNTINATQAAEVISQVEPRIVIPMHYKTKAFAGKLEGVEKFFKEMGLKDVEERDSLKLNTSASQEETQVVVLKY